MTDRTISRLCRRMIEDMTVRGAHAAGAETLWRDDALYDVVVVLGHNDDPVAPGAGSAIFLHVARPDFGPTEGCVAVRREDLLEILAACDETTRLCVSATAGDGSRRVRLRA